MGASSVSVEFWAPDTRAMTRNQEERQHRRTRARRSAYGCRRIMEIKISTPSERIAISLFLTRKVPNQLNNFCLLSVAQKVFFIASNIPGFTFSECEKSCLFGVDLWHGGVKLPGAEPAGPAGGDQQDAGACAEETDGASPPPVKRRQDSGERFVRPNHRPLVYIRNNNSSNSSSGSRPPARKKSKVVVCVCVIKFTSTPPPGQAGSRVLVRGRVCARVACNEAAPQR